jgi:prepilin-type N-terminal cleavage/methylation domain-containing protein
MTEEAEERFWGSRRKAAWGFTLIEIIMALALFSMCIFLVINVIPTGVMTLKKAEDLQSASLYGQEIIEDAVRSFPKGAAYFPVKDREFDITMNSTQFHVTREIYNVDTCTPPKLFDIVVVVSWDRQPMPLRLGRRLFLRD